MFGSPPNTPTDPRFIKLFCQAIEKLGKRFDADPVFDSIDISLPGAWGEGYDLDLYRKEDILKIFDTYIDSFPHTQLIAQFLLPEYLYYTKEKAAIGWRADGLGDPYHTQEMYPHYIEKIADFWKTSPVSFEAYWWMGEWKRKGWDIDEIIEKTLEWHISSFNPKSIPIPYEWKDKVDYWLSRMGYHFAVDSFSYPEEAVGGDDIQLVLCVDNIGVAPCYRRIPLSVSLKGAEEYVFETDVDIRNWMPGKHTATMNITLPENIPSGHYDIRISLYNDVAKTVYLATDAACDGRWYTLGEIHIPQA